MVEVSEFLLSSQLPQQDEKRTIDETTTKKERIIRFIITKLIGYQILVYRADKILSIV